jgi:CPA1 family monovalent cation:H+ antiporter
MCRRVVLHQLIVFNDRSLTPLLGERLAALLKTILKARISTAEHGLADVRRCFGQASDVLERRMLLLYALREGRERVQAMYEDRSISKEIYDSIRRELDAAWKLAVPRAHPDLVPGETQAKEIHTRIDALNVGGAEAYAEPAKARTDTAAQVLNAAAEERRPSP